MKTALFLHMGPGLNAYCERQLVGPDTPHIEYWDQPKIPKGSGAFLQLVRQTCEKIKKLSDRSGQAITLIGHSFGGHLATEALKTVGDLVKQCEFISTGYDIPSGFHNLLKLLAEDAGTPAEVRRQAHEFLKTRGLNPTRERFWEYLGLIVRDPNFLRLYWPSPWLFERYQVVSQSAPPLDGETFQNVLSDFLDHHWSETPSPSAWSGSTRFRLGQKDPLLVMDKEVELWRRVYPNASFEMERNSGHYLHLEDALNKTER